MRAGAHPRCMRDVRIVVRELGSSIREKREAEGRQKSEDEFSMVHGDGPGAIRADRNLHCPPG